MISPAVDMLGKLSRGVLDGFLSLLSPSDPRLRGLAVERCRALFYKTAIPAVATSLCYYFIKFGVVILGRLLPDHADMIFRLYPHQSAWLWAWFSDLPGPTQAVFFIQMEETLLTLVASNVLHWLGNPGLGSGGSDRMRTYCDADAVRTSAGHWSDMALVRFFLPPSMRWIGTYCWRWWLQNHPVLGEEETAAILDECSLSQMLLKDAPAFGVAVVARFARRLLAQSLRNHSYTREAAVIEHATFLYTLNIAGQWGGAAFALFGAAARRLDLRWYHLAPGVFLFCSSIGMCMSTVMLPIFLDLWPRGVLVRFSTIGRYGAAWGCANFLAAQVTARYQLGRYGDQMWVNEAYSASDMVAFFSRQDSSTLDELQAELLRRVADGTDAHSPTDRTQVWLGQLLHYREQLELGHVTRGLSSRTLDRTTNRTQYTRTQGEAPLMCVFCQTDLEEGAEIREFPCLHRYHVACVDQWMRRSKVCPTCRQDPVVLTQRTAALSSAATPATPPAVEDSEA
eukprot:Hpha_TRINITY_DN26282_c0_g1::TRINITY_DN26282_c0_g1_i1::g.184621::m.184621